MHKTVMFDVDGVLADFVLGFTTLANAMFGTRIISTPEQESWNFHEWGLMTKEQENATWQVVKETPLWWVSLEPLISKGTFHRINSLRLTHEIVFATNRVSFKEPPGWQTRIWLENHGIDLPSVVVSKKKGDIARAIGAAVSLEDKLENAWCVHWISDHPQTTSYVINRPYNQKGEGPAVGKDLPRVDTVDQFLNLIEGG